MTEYQRQTASNLRHQWRGTDAFCGRDGLVQAIRTATDTDARRPSVQDVKAIADALADLAV